MSTGIPASRARGQYTAGSSGFGMGLLSINPLRALASTTVLSSRKGGPIVGCCTMLYMRPSALVLVTSSRTLKRAPASLTMRRTYIPANGRWVLISTTTASPCCSGSPRSSHMLLPASPWKGMPLACSAADGRPTRSRHRKCPRLRGASSPPSPSHLSGLMSLDSR